MNIKVIAQKSLYTLMVIASFGIMQAKELVIIGGGFVAGLEAYYAYQKAQASGESLCITVYEKNANVFDTTSCNICPSLTMDEIVSVVPRGPILQQKMNILFNLPGGIRVEDVPLVHSGLSTQSFVDNVFVASADEQAETLRTQVLLAMGKMSMDMWHELYVNADDEMKEILQTSNFNVCKEMDTPAYKHLFDGYRIDLLYGIDNAVSRAIDMITTYTKFGYQNCAILTPEEVMQIDPFLTDFCSQHTTVSQDGALHWNQDAIAVWRPGGCLYVRSFLPQVYAYLQKHMGTVVDQRGQERAAFNIEFQKQVTGVTYSTDDIVHPKIDGLLFADGSSTSFDKNIDTEFVFCPGEAVGTLKKLGFDEPAYAGFAGASLSLFIEIPQELQKSYEAFNHCMEVQQEGVVLAWQARTIDDQVVIFVAGTKAFYGDQQPDKNQDFAIDRNILQLNMINNVLPEFVSLALGRDTYKQNLTREDLQHLEQLGIATRWVGRRAVVYDGFPTLGHVYHHGACVSNARCTTHLGSGGVSFGPAAVKISQSVMNEKIEQTDLVLQILGFADSRRMAVQ